MELLKLTPRARPLSTGICVTSLHVLAPAQAVGVGVPCNGALPWPELGAAQEPAAGWVGGGAPDCDADTDAPHTPPNRATKKMKARIDFLIPLTVLLSFR